MPLSNNNVILVSNLPPNRCGIASYAGEHLRQLVADGRTLFTISMSQDSEADVHVDLTRVISCLSFLRLGLHVHADELIVHYADDSFFPLRMPKTSSRLLCRLFQTLALRILARRTAKSWVVIHELPTHRTLPWFNTWTREFALRKFTKISFHTEAMRQEFLSRFKGISESQTNVVEHTQFMRRKFEGSRMAARAQIGLPQSDLILLCMGFLHEAKGFHDAIQAFSIAQPELGVQLHIVGSAHADSRDAMSYAENLRFLCASSTQIYIHEDYLDEISFDTWLAAADFLILPYLGVASSGVGARASLYGTSLIVRNLTNLTEQFPDAEIFSTKEDLAMVIRNHARLHGKTSTR